VLKVSFKSLTITLWSEVLWQYKRWLEKEEIAHLKNRL